MFNKKQRQNLGVISSALFGSETRWQKMYNAGAFDQPEYTEVEEPVTQVMVNNSKKGRGTIYNIGTAIENGVVQAPEGGQELVKVKKLTSLKRPNHEELVHHLMMLCKQVALSRVSTPEDLILLLAVDFVGNTLNFPVKLVKQDTEQYKKDSEDYEKILTQELKDRVAPLAATAQEPDNSLRLDYNEFLAQVVFANTHKEEASLLAQDLVAKAMSDHRRSL